MSTAVPAGGMEPVVGVRGGPPADLSGRVVWNKTKKRDAGGKTAPTARPESEWLRLHREDLRIVSDDVWTAVHQRIDAARVRYDRATQGQRRYQPRDQDSKNLLTGFGRCRLCGGGLCVRSRGENGRRGFFYACTAHLNKGAAICPHADQWPMEELDREVLATIADAVLTPDVVEEVVLAAREMFDASTQADHQVRLRQALATVEREQARMADAIAAGAGEVAAVVERLRTTEAKRRALMTELEKRNRHAQRRRGASSSAGCGRACPTGAHVSKATSRRRAWRSESYSTDRSSSRPLSSVGIAQFGSRDASDWRRFLGRNGSRIWRPQREIALMTHRHS